MTVPDMVRPQAIEGRPCQFMIRQGLRQARGQAGVEQHGSAQATAYAHPAQQGEEMAPGNYGGGHIMCRRRRRLVHWIPACAGMTGESGNGTWGATLGDTAYSAAEALSSLCTRHRRRRPFRRRMRRDRSWICRQRPASPSLTVHFET